MYKTMLLDKRLCRMMCQNFKVLLNDCSASTLWPLCPTSAITRNVHDIFYLCPLCRPELFPLLYWLVLFNSTMGSIYTLFEFIDLYWGRRNCLSMWRARKYYIVSDMILKKCRLLGAAVMFNSWGLLLYGVIFINHVYMLPWLAINLFVMTFELLSWLFEVVVGAARINIHTLLTFFLLISNYILVLCTRQTFLGAEDMKDDLRLWKNVL